MFGAIKKYLSFYVNIYNCNPYLVKKNIALAMENFSIEMDVYSYCLIFKNFKKKDPGPMWMESTATRFYCFLS